ncbi:hypothetical protein Metlim_1406 [Methanoplanus limicola DSM 2279]|jgi:hypothetical protein|uniref:Uncharacterized protein n=1 Tax=Methanoplanus limicola DSM 2279 TaxID=937775 RepID=H1Z2I6_9EURY|nr:hypothetical protein Metlim_1406 [Methanoplanus limicola DSM 2279]
MHKTICKTCKNELTVMIDNKEENKLGNEDEYTEIRKS